MDQEKNKFEAVEWSEKDMGSLKHLFVDDVPFIDGDKLAFDMLFQDKNTFNIPQPTISTENKSSGVSIPLMRSERNKDSKHTTKTRKYTKRSDEFKFLRLLGPEIFDELVNEALEKQKLHQDLKKKERAEREKKQNLELKKIIESEVVIKERPRNKSCAFCGIQCRGLEKYSEHIKHEHGGD